jgi:hypothetical protein
VSWAHYVASIVQGAAAIALLQLPADARIFVFVPLLALGAIYAAWVMRRVRRAGIVLG